MSYFKFEDKFCELINFENPDKRAIVLIDYDMLFTHKEPVLCDTKYHLNSIQFNIIRCLSLCDNKQIMVICYSDTELDHFQIQTTFSKFRLNAIQMMSLNKKQIVSDLEKRGYKIMFDISKTSI